MTTPISGTGGSGYIPASSLTFQEFLFGPNLQQDTISSSSSDPPNGFFLGLDAGRVSINEFSDAVLGSLDASKASIRKSNLARIDSDSVIGSARFSLTFVALLQDLMTKAAQDSIDLNNIINSQIDGQNQIIDQYNQAVDDSEPYPGSDQDALDQLNQAIEDYNNGNIDENQLNDAIQTYKDYQTQRNQTLEPLVNDYNESVAEFNEQTAANNQAIDDLNQERTNAALPPDTPSQSAAGAASLMPDPPSPPYTIPVSGVTSQVKIPDLSHVPPPLSVGDTLQIYLSPIVDAMTIQFKLSDKIFKAHAETSEFIQFFIQNPNKITQISTVVNQAPTVKLPGGSEGLGGGVALASMVIDLGLPHSTQIISNGVFMADSKTFQLKATSPNLSVIEILNTRLIQMATLEAALESGKTLGPSVLASSNAPQAFSIAFTSAFVKNISAFIESDQISNVVKELVDKEINTGSSEEDKSRLATLLTAETKQTLLATGLLVASQALGLPGLAAQFLSNAAGRDIQAEVNTSNTQTAIQLSTQAFLKSLLSQYITSSVADRLINEATENNLTTANQLQDLLINAGIEKEQAVRLASLVSTAIQGETPAIPLVNPALVSQEQISAELTNQLVQQHYDLSAAARLAELAVQEVFANGVIFNANQLKISLQAQLENKGITPSSAIASTTAAITNLNTVAPGTLPLLNPLPTGETLTLDQLLSALHGLVQEKAAIAAGQDKARELADELVQALITNNEKNPSLYQQFLANSKIFEELGGNEGKKIVLDGYQILSIPPYDLLAFSLQVMDPAYALLHSFQAGISHAGLTKPDKFKKELDIIV